MLRNHLFEHDNTKGMDLPAINIMRGRDHGLPSLNNIRSALGLEKFTDFKNISINSNIVRIVAETYENVEDW